MEFKRKVSSLMFENLTIVMLLVILIIGSTLIMKLVPGFILTVLLYDQIRNRDYHIRLEQKQLVEHKAKIDKIIKLKDIEFITLNKKLKRAIIIGNQENYIVLKNDIQNRAVLVNELKGKVEDSTFIHPNIDEFLRKYK